MKTFEGRLDEDGLRRTEFKIGGREICQLESLAAANFEFCTSEPSSEKAPLGIPVPGALRLARYVAESFSVS
jgi:hypothetical protein